MKNHEQCFDNYEKIMKLWKNFKNNKPIFETHEQFFKNHEHFQKSFWKILNIFRKIHETFSENDKPKLNS
jgi:hypothetical protein